jgi:Subtilase family
MFDARFYASSVRGLSSKLGFMNGQGSPTMTLPPNALSIGLLDTTPNLSLPDLRQARIVRHIFCDSSYRKRQDAHNHGTASVGLLVGQGDGGYRGLCPRAHLFLAEIGSEESFVGEHVMADALRWFRHEKVALVAIPYGRSQRSECIEALLQAGHAEGCIYFAAAGQCGSQQLLYPASSKYVRSVRAGDIEGEPLLPDNGRAQSDVIAPGWGVRTLDARGQHTSANGSSIACVVAAGAQWILKANQGPKGTVAKDGV